MRVVFWLVFTLAVITGALYGVGRFLLDNSLEVSRSITVERPRVAVFAMVNDLRTMKEWSPYYAMDPEAEYTFSGDTPGRGQTMRWRSSVREVGQGRMTIVQSIANREVDGVMQLGERASLNTRMILSRTGSSDTAVQWSVSAACQEGAVNVPCRYMNLLLRTAISKELDNGLARLKSLAEQLPDVDFEGLQVEIVRVSPRPFVYSAAQTSLDNPAEVDRALAMGIDAVQRFMADSALVRAGPLVRQTTAWNAAAGRMSFNVGYPFTGPAPLTVVAVQIGQTPGGEALKVVHVGPRATVQDTYMKAYAYLQAHRIPQPENGMPWEVVLDDGAVDPSSTRIEIYIPLQ